jgi:hypothetical protein
MPYYFGTGAIAAPGFPLLAPSRRMTLRTRPAFIRSSGSPGVENGVGITGLQPTGTTIPRNEPYAIDNLVSAVEPHLTAYGFGFSLANGNYANPFFKDSSYYQYLSIPP